MKKFLIYFILALLLVSFSFAEEKEVIYDQWTKHISNFTYEGDLFQITSSNLDYYQDDTYKEGRISVWLNGKTLKIVKFGQCERNDFFEVCFVNATIDNNYIDNSVFNSLIPAVKLKVSEYIYNDSLNLTRKVSLDEVTVGDEVLVELNLNNNGSLNLYNFNLVEKLGGEWTVVDKCEEFTFVDEGLSYNGTLETTNDIDLWYSLKLNAYVNESEVISKVKYDTLQMNGRVLDNEVYFFDVIQRDEDVVEDEEKDEQEDVVEDEDKEEDYEIPNEDNVDDEVDIEDAGFLEKLLYLIKNIFSLN